jgi:hypothetical protein
MSVPLAQARLWNRCDRRRTGRCHRWEEHHLRARRRRSSRRHPYLGYSDCPNRHRCPGFPCPRSWRARRESFPCWSSCGRRRTWDGHLWRHRNSMCPRLSIQCRTRMRLRRGNGLMSSTRVKRRKGTRLLHDVASNAMASCPSVLQTTCEHGHAQPRSALEVVSSAKSTFPQLIRSGLWGGALPTGAGPCGIGYAHPPPPCELGFAIWQTSGKRTASKGLARVPEESRRIDVALTDV